ncbi:MAG: membrane dipeptidase [Lachnospiraceae bacterium]|nr:membrane dipeptidase [Lachnospiraceae bacterium]
MKIVDMHCDTVSVMLEKRRAGEAVTLRENHGHLDLNRMKESGYLLQNFALYVDKGSCVDPWDEVCDLYEVYRQEISANEDIIAEVLKYDDIVINQKMGKLSSMLTVEEGAVCKGDIEKLKKLYDMGVRMLTLTWNYQNELGSPNVDKVAKAMAQDAGENTVHYSFKPNTSQGLTDRGREFVTEMERLGMIIDVSHLSDAGFYDVLECTHKPFVASHSNARSICRHVRNLTDDMIRKLAERGGCMGLNYYADFLTEGTNGGYGGIEAMVQHAKHITDIGGMEVLGLGSDFDGIDTNRELPGVQGMELLWNALHKGGFTQGELDKIFYQNVLRVYRDCLI